MVDQRWPIKVGARWAWQSIKPTPKCPCLMRVLCEKRVLDLVVETRMQQGILGFVKRNYYIPLFYSRIEGILPKGPYPPCLRMADRALLAGYPRDMWLLVHALISMLVQLISVSRRGPSWSLLFFAIYLKWTCRLFSWQKAFNFYIIVTSFEYHVHPQWTRHDNNILIMSKQRCWEMS